MVPRAVATWAAEPDEEPAPALSRPPPRSRNDACGAMLSARLVRLAVDWYRRSAMRWLCCDGAINGEAEEEEDVVDVWRRLHVEAALEVHNRLADDAAALVAADTTEEVVAGHATRRSSRASIAREEGERKG